MVPVLALAILPHAVHSHQVLMLAVLVMETVIVVMIAIYLPRMTAVQMLPALVVSMLLILIFAISACNEYNNGYNINSYYYSADPTMCAHVGIYGCCNGTPAACEVRNGQDRCFCDTSCHTRGDCCPDACAREFDPIIIYCDSIRFMLHHNNYYYV